VGQNMTMWIKRNFKIVDLIISDIGKQDLFSKAAALSYYCALSLAPFIMLTITIFSFFGPATIDSFMEQVKFVVGNNAAEAILSIIQTAKDQKTARGVSGALGILTLLISASAVFSQLKSTIVAIFLKKKECTIEDSGGTWIEFFKEKLFSIGMMVSFIFLSLISLMFSSALPLILPSDEGWFWQAINFFISLGIYALVFFLVFYYVSNRQVKRKEAWVGGIIAAVLFVIGRSLISVYLVKSAVGSAYGAAGSLIVLLAWVYYSSFIVFVSGVITRNIKTIREMKQNNK
jgi:membrane protein